ncbi:MAG: hypothetical protein HY287_07045 [Planctomycetes bacterium]|nr:hypothetical protein [Planctomycetota bacterium]MBI3834071.1 hypothetical protein [Planctomycetota bacterium]
MDAAETNDRAYLDLICGALRVCLNYKPSCGHGRQGGVTIEEFQRIYREDEFYAWFGLDSPLVYAAHKAAGGMTSIYRQIGTGCQLLFHRILQDTLGLSPTDATWSYNVPSTKGKFRTLSLDGRIAIENITSSPRRSAVESWLKEASASIGLKGRNATSLHGAVFEVRQAYKSNDAKRQNADVSNAASAFAYRYLPVMLLFSVQIPLNLAERYARARWLMLRGAISGTTVDSTYVFCREVLGYDLAGFFRRNSEAIKKETLAVFEGLLR